MKLYSSLAPAGPSSSSGHGSLGSAARAGGLVSGSSLHRARAGSSELLEVPA